MAREKFPSDEVDRLMVRFPSGMRERIAEEAKANGRSMNSEIVSRLQASLESADRVRRTIYHGDRPLELDEEAIDGMLLLFEQVRERHDAKYGVTPPERRRPVAFPLKVATPEPMKSEDLTEEEISESLEWLHEEQKRLEAEIQRRAKSRD